MSKLSSVIKSIILIGVAAMTMPSVMAQNMQVTRTPLTIQHVKIVSPKPYAEVKRFIESLNRFDVFATKIREYVANNDMAGYRDELKRLTGEYGFALHHIMPTGESLRIKGERRDLMAYLIGNVLMSTEMTKLNSAASLYAPLRIVLYANEGGGTTVEYDLPSSLFGQFKDPEIDKVAAVLDERLLALISKATQ